MTVQSYGREPGYPETDVVVEGDRVITTHRDRRKVITNDDADVGQVLLAQLPYQPGVLFEDGVSRLVRMKLKRHAETRFMHFLDLEYDPRGEDATEQNQPPENRTPEWAWDFETIERIITQDVNGVPTVNGVGEPFELTVPRALPVLTIERWEQTFDPNTILNYMNKVNDAAFWGAPVGTALMAGIRDRKDTQEIWNGVFYRKVTYTIKFALPFIADSLEGWKEILLNRGTFFYDDIDPALKFHFTDENGAQITGNLDAQGFALADGLPPELLRFDIFEEADFSALNLGPY